MIPCVCGHMQHHGEPCWCGCTIYLPDDGADTESWCSRHRGDAFIWKATTV